MATIRVWQDHNRRWRWHSTDVPSYPPSGDFLTLAGLLRDVMDRLDLDERLEVIHEAPLGNPGA